MQWQTQNWKQGCAYPTRVQTVFSFLFFLSLKSYCKGAAVSESSVHIYLLCLDTVADWGHIRVANLQISSLLHCRRRVGARSTTTLDWLEARRSAHAWWPHDLLLSAQAATSSALWLVTTCLSGQ
jgi:hypothetical protein